MSQTYAGIFPIQPGSAIDPSKSFFAVTPNDNAQVRRGRAVYVGTGGGDLTVIGWNDSSLTPVTFKNIGNGVLLPIEVLYVMATGTSVSDIVILQ